MKRWIVCFVLILWSVACSESHAPHIESGGLDTRPPQMLMAFGVATFEHGRLYGSLAHLYGGKIAGQTMPLIEVRLTDIRGEAREVDVLVDMEGWARPWRQSVVVAAGRTQWVSATPELALPRIYRQTDMASAKVTVTVIEHDVVLVRQHKALEIQPVEQFTWFSREGADDPLEDMRPFLATMIRAPKLPQSDVSARGVMGRVESLYVLMRSQMGRIHELDRAFFQQPSQVRLAPIEPVHVVEGVVWLAGALEAVGVEVALVFLSDHLLLGFKAGGHHHFLDLTVDASFEHAITMGNRVFLARQDDPLLRFVTLRTLRRMGISSMPY